MNTKFSRDTRSPTDTRHAAHARPARLALPRTALTAPSGDAKNPPSKLSMAQIEAQFAVMEHQKEISPTPQPNTAGSPPAERTRTLESTWARVMARSRLPRQLPSDILIMIFEELRDSPSLPGIRLVSSQFNQLIIPITYRHIVLTNRILAVYPLGSKLCDEHISAAQATKNIELYTRHITINRPLKWLLLMKLLESLENLRYVTYVSLVLTVVRADIQHFSVSYATYLVGYCPSAQFKQMESYLRYLWPNAHFLIDGLDASAAWKTRSINSTTSPPSETISFKVAEWSSRCAPPPPINIERFNKYLVKKSILGRPILEILHLVSEDDCVSIDDRDIEGNDRLPPLKELVLKGYDWKHSPEVAITFWDWSRITYLDLRRVPICKFLQTVGAEHLLQLRTFMTDGYCAEREQEQAQATVLMCNLVSQIRSLERLSLTLSMGSECVSAILERGQNLHSLELRDYSGGKALRLPDDMRCIRVSRHEEAARRSLVRISQITSLDDLEAIRQRCPHLMELTLDCGTFKQVRLSG
ncbi:hypothetical protein MMC28_008601 [Mycoblastus sanguinarius]|nr:hypothetical protein [Mycoblastus sanguinarius]